MRRFIVVACVLVLFGAVHWYRQRPIEHAAGVLVDSEPLQSAPSSRALIRHGDFELTPLADYTIQARVLSRRDYTFDGGSKLAPTDLAVGWERLSDSAVLDQLELSQSARYFFWRWEGKPPIRLDEITRSAANMHMIPADSGVARELARVRVGEVITMRGELVDARDGHGWRWTSSLRRDDTGDGACELMLVDSIER